MHSGLQGAAGGCRGLRPRCALLTLEKALEKDPVERLVIDGGAVRLGGAGGGPFWKESASGSAGAPRADEGKGGRPSFSKDGCWFSKLAFRLFCFSKLFFSSRAAGWGRGWGRGWGWG